MEKIKMARIFRCSARQLLLLTGMFLFIFSLLSGTEQYGGGFKGILYNSPNTLPSLVLLGLLLFAWKNELIGGMLIIIFGLGSFYYFVLSTTYSHWFTTTASVSVIIFGIFFLLSWYIRRTVDDQSG